MAGMNGPVRDRVPAANVPFKRSRRFRLGFEILAILLLPLFIRGA